MFYESAPSIQPVSAAPVGSLAELRKRHSAMLQRQASEVRDQQPCAGEILGFLEVASAAGGIIEDPDSREVAQGILDFWTSKLLTLAPQAAASSRPFSLQDFDASSVEGVRTQVEQFRSEADDAAARGTSLAGALPALERENLLHLLGSFVRLKENSLDAYTVPVSTTDALLLEPEHQPLVAKLTAAGILREAPSPEPGAPATLSIVHDSLLKSWPTLKEAAARRKAFRELARGWDKSSRSPASLLNRSTQLDQALEYRDISPVEHDFLESSRRQSEKQHRNLITYGGVIIAALAGMLGLTIWALMDAKISNRKLEEQKATLVEQKATLETQKLALEEAEQARLKNATASRQAVATTAAALHSQRAQSLQQAKSALQSIAAPAEISPAIDAAIKKIETDLAGPAAESFTGVKVEIFVDQSLPKAVERAQPWLDALKAAGIAPMHPTALGKAVVADPTEVRCFNEEDLPLAYQVAELLHKSGFKQMIVVVNESDAEVAKKFIQISIAQTVSSETAK